MTESEYQALYSWVQKQCARMELSPYKVLQKLMARGATQQEAKQLIELLLAEGFLSPIRFAQAYVHDKTELEHWGRHKIAYKLRTEHRIPEPIITEALQAVNPDHELQTLIELIRHKLPHTTNPDNTTLIARCIRFALQRGFTQQQARVAIKAILNKTENQ